jgi:TfoX/Sxy family transcriptional regulator of competence genes
MAWTENFDHNQGTYSWESCVQPNLAFRGLGDKAEDFIEQGHQEGVADGHWLKLKKNYAKKESSARKTSQLINHPNVLAKKEEEAQKAKKEFTSSEVERAKSQQAIRVSLETIVKSEKWSKFVDVEQ